MRFKTFYESRGQYLPPNTASKIVKAINRIGGKIWVVGGAVRDALNPESPPSKDIDLLVTNLDFNDPDLAIKAIIEVLNPISESVGVFGERFGVIKAVVDGEDLDIAIPREKEEKTGSGHADFNVVLDPRASVEDDLARRDFTINAMASSLDGSQIVDKFGGLEDMKNKVIRAVGNPFNRFSEDPIRMIRAIQFAARFGFSIEPSTFKAMRKHADLIKDSKGEPVLEELKKGLVKGKADMKTFVDALMNSGIGKEYFGNDFNPIPIDSKNLYVRIVAMFIRGGDFKKIKPTTEMITVMRLTKDFMSDKMPFEYIRDEKTKSFLPVVKEFFESIQSNLASRVSRAMKLPVLPKDLVISGKDLMEMGIKGKKIGEIQRSMLAGIWSGKLNNTVESLSKYIQEDI